MKKLSLPKQRILKKNSAFHEIFRFGKAIHGKYFSVFYKITESNKIGFAAKGYKNKVQRNKLKRIGREMYRTHQYQIIRPIHAVFVVKSLTLTKNYETLVNDFDELVKSLNSECCNK